MRETKTVGKALYRKYRSKSLGEIVGQAHVTDILERSLHQGKVAHAYLLTGPRGVGKTSIARILAHEINKLPYSEESVHLDIIEIDAASNNGVEDVRDLREKVQIAPVSAARKIYIIDEVHMLSKAAFNALLKTLEEPPEHAVFILATTDADKLPATIISRTQRFHFKLISQADVIKHLKHIAKSEAIKISDEALKLIAVRGEGSFRDSISLLDQLQSLSDDKEGITAELVEKSLGIAAPAQVTKLLEAYEQKDLKSIVSLLDESEASGVQPGVLAAQLVHTIREVIAEKPQYLELLDHLLEVAKSTQPDIKLLTVLASHTTPKPKTIALSAPPLEVSAPIKELEKQATQKKPELSTDTDTASLTNGSVDISSQASSAGDISNEKDQRDPSASEMSSAPDSDESATTTTFDWAKLIEHTRQNFVAIYSVLSKCAHEYDGHTLTLYTGNAFYKKKLDDSKYRGNLAKSLSEIGAGEPQIETIGSPPPPKDSIAASVAAIMGGGEEVTVEA